MSRKALVAFGVVLGFGLFAHPVPGGCSESKFAKPAISRTADTAPNISAGIPDKPKTGLSALSLEEALARARKQNPKLAAFSREVRAREFEALQAGRRRNPELSIEVENVGGTGQYSGAGSAETTLRVSQALELGGKRARRVEVGRLESELAEREYDIVCADVLSETAERFFAVLAAQERLSLAEAQVRATEKVLQAVEERIEAGKAADLESIRFQTRLAEASLRREKALQELAVLRQALAIAWGSPEADFDAVEGSLEAIAPVPDWTALTALLDKSPRAGLQNAESKMGERILALERANRIPDLTVSLGVRNDRDEGDSAWVAEIALPLPIFDRNQDAVSAARARKEKARENANSAQLQMRAELAGFWQQLQAASSEAATLHDRIIPDSRKAFDAVSYGYQAGKFGFLEVLDAEQTLFEAESRYIDALSACHSAILEIERLLGQKVSTVNNLSASSSKKRGPS